MQTPVPDLIATNLMHETQRESEARDLLRKTQRSLLPGWFVGFEYVVGTVIAIIFYLSGKPILESIVSGIAFCAVSLAAVSHSGVTSSKQTSRSSVGFAPQD